MRKRPFWVKKAGDVRPDLLLVTPPAQGSGAVWLRAARAARELLLTGRITTVGGHSAVTRSVLAGLEGERTVSWRYTVSDSAWRAEVLHVLAGVDLVSRGIACKKDGRCKFLIAGPNIVVSPRENGAILASPEIDLVLVPSEWVKVAYIEEEPRLAGRIKVWASGVDTRYWEPRNASTKNLILIYDKFCAAETAATDAYLRSLGMETRIVRYGKYRRNAFRDLLDTCMACIVLNKGESQGIALAEAWSMDVPTFVKRRDVDLDTGRRLSSAPYLTSHTGSFWSDLRELPKLVDARRRHSPREWVQRNLSDEISALNLLSIVRHVQELAH